MNAINDIQRLIKENRFDEDAQIFVVLGMPISDIGKGTLIAHLLSGLEDSDAIKFDGLLNTNKSGRHTAKGHDDFGIYEKYNVDKTFGKERYIIGGELYQEFIDEYGECENLCFRPHVQQFFVKKVCEIYQNIGKPKILMLEIGGTIIDYEVDSYVSPAIYFLKKQLGEKCKIILMSELGYNNVYIKTRSLQRAVEELGKRFILPDLILAREPSEMPIADYETKIINEKEISLKISERIGLTFPPNKIITIPFYQQKEIDEFGDYVSERIIPIVNGKKSIFLGSTNKSKLKDYRSYLPEYNVICPNDLGINMNIKENTYSLMENSQKKALERAKASDLPTLSEDTGFYINAMGGLPGVSVKRRGGTLEKELSNKEFLPFFKDQVKDLKDTSCYFYTIFSLGFPDGKVVSISHKTAGYIDLERFENIATPDYPLSAVFIANGRGKTWSECTEEEKKISDSKVIHLLHELLEDYDGKI